MKSQSLGLVVALTTLILATCILTGCKPEGATAQAATPSATSNSGPKKRAPKSSDSTRQRDISFDDLEFEIERDADFEREMLTPQIEELDECKVKIYGFILPASVFTQTFDKFVLVKDNLECCFGPGAYIYHNIQVEMDEGKTADFSVRPVAVEGVLSIKPWFGPDGKCYSVFHLQASKVGN